MTDRKILIKRLLIIFALGLSYFIWLKLTELGIPCIVRLISGGKILCPGCGVTTMCLNIIGGNIKAAFEANPCIFILLPVWIVFILIRIIFQPKCLSDKKPLNQAFYFAMAGILFVFGILRNLVNWGILEVF